MGISAVSGAIPYIQFVSEKFRSIINDVVLRLSYFSINPFVTAIRSTGTLSLNRIPRQKCILCVNGFWRLKLLWRFISEQRHLDMFLEEKGLLFQTR